MHRYLKGGYKALIAYITAGYPDIKATPEIAQALAENGCDIIELGIPFSDPLADGATIQKASYQALQRGTTPEACLEAAEEIRRKIKTPLVFMTYYNPVLNYGLEAFCRSCRKAGINGLIVPDLPPEEGSELEAITRKHDLDLIYMLAPTSTEARIAEVGEKVAGIYLPGLPYRRYRRQGYFIAGAGRFREKGQAKSQATVMRGLRDIQRGAGPTRRRRSRRRHRGQPPHPAD